ncbi:uncharacterized protein K02A2.6-like [Galendromus occidentalis]|uniref:RNA-directed DNA polymerase n=1 Tax=Galendromus occidentalis TaxID=34638 RepID=A0AAJ6QMI7_9ACAR|nr:uncharacterized protein K02A2.6-like [Galendromus occidentalis]
MAFSAEQVQLIVSAAVTEALKNFPRERTSTSAHTIMEHINSRIPKFTFKSDEGHTFEKCLFKRRIKSLRIKRSGRPMKELMGLINEAAEEAEWGDITLDKMKQYILMLSPMNPEDNDIRARAARLMEENEDEYSFPEIIDDVEHFEQLKKDLNPTAKSRFEINKIQKKSPRENAPPKDEQQPSTSTNYKKPCYRCAKTNHHHRDCRHKNTTCSIRSKVGHLPRACFSNRSTDFTPDRNVRQIRLQPNNVRRFTKQVTISGRTFSLTLDTGAEVSLISRRIWSQLNKPALRSPTVSLTLADGNPLRVIGTFRCAVRMNSLEFHTDCHVTENCELLGLDWIQRDPELKKFLQDQSRNPPARSIQSVMGSIDIKEEEIQKNLKRKFPEVFTESLGKCTTFEATFKVKENSAPSFKKARPVAYALLPKIVDEIERLVSEDVLEPTAHSKYAAPVVIVQKKDGTIRLCADYSTGLNNSIEDDAYPLPTAESIFAKLNGGRYFSQLDLAEAYLQIPVESQSQELLTINTAKGLFKMKRLAYGVKTAPSLFQRLMDTITNDLPGTTAYLDDILVTSSTIEEHEGRLAKVFQRLQENGLRIREEKCSFLRTEVKFLGFILSGEGRKPDPDKTKAIVEMPSPRNISELRAALGMITFYSQFIPDMKTLKEPMNNLLKKDTGFEWTHACERSFQKMKQCLQSDLLLTHYDPNLPIIISADASQSGIGCVLLHEMPNQTQKAIMHASRSLSDTERKYSQIEKEALALVYAVKKFHKFIFGRKFILNTDHKPLLSIFGSKNGISAHSANRLQRWAVILLDYQFEIRYKKTTDFGEADALSRLIVEQQSHLDGNNELPDKVIASIELDDENSLDENIAALPVTRDEIRRGTLSDRILSRAKKFIDSQWPKISREDALFALYSRRSELSISGGIILFRNRVVIPADLQKEVLTTLHNGHPGETRMKALARSYVYWPQIDDQIKEFVRSCDDCQLASKNPVKIPLSPWEKPEGPWKRIHADFAGPMKNVHYLIIVDSFSNWPEIIPMKKITTANTIEAFESLFTQYGVPEEIVTDHGTQFTAHDFKEFCRRNDIKKSFSAVNFPQSNGRAERMVDTFKRALSKMQREGTTSANIQKFLRSYRTIPSRALDGKTPAEMFTGRKFRTELDMLLPQARKNHAIASIQTSRYEARMKKNFDRHHGVREKSFETNDPVYVRMERHNKQYWAHGNVERRNNVMYDVEVENRTTLRHANQLRRRHTPNQHRQGDVYDGLMLAFEMPLPKRRTTTRGREETQVEKQMFQTPEPITPIICKMETLCKKIKAMDGQAVTGDERDALMESIRALEEQVGEADPEIRALLQETQRVMKETDMKADDVSQLLENLSIQEAPSQPTSSRYSAHQQANTAQQSLADEIAEAVRSARPSVEDVATTTAERPATTKTRGPEASVEIPSTSARRELFRSGATSDSEEDPSPLERSIFDNQEPIAFKSPEENRIALPTRNRKRTSFLDVTHTKSPRYKSRKKY